MKSLFITAVIVSVLYGIALFVMAHFGVFSMSGFSAPWWQVVIAFGTGVFLERFAWRYLRLMRLIDKQRADAQPRVE